MMFSSKFFVASLLVPLSLDLRSDITLLPILRPTTNGTQTVATITLSSLPSMNSTDHLKIETQPAAAKLFDTQPAIDITALPSWSPFVPTTVPFNAQPSFTSPVTPKLHHQMLLEYATFVATILRSFGTVALETYNGVLSTLRRSSASVSHPALARLSIYALSLMDPLHDLYNCYTADLAAFLSDSGVDVYSNVLSNHLRRGVETVVGAALARWKARGSSIMMEISQVWTDDMQQRTYVLNAIVTAAAAYLPFVNSALVVIEALFFLSWLLRYTIKNVQPSSTSRDEESYSNCSKSKKRRIRRQSNKSRKSVPQVETSTASNDPWWWTARNKIYGVAKMVSDCISAAAASLCVIGGLSLVALDQFREIACLRVISVANVVSERASVVAATLYFMGRGLVCAAVQSLRSKRSNRSLNTSAALGETSYSSCSKSKKRRIRRQRMKALRSRRSEEPPNELADTGSVEPKDCVGVKIYWSER